MDASRKRFIRVPRATRLEQLNCRPQAVNGSSRRVTVVRSGNETGHFLLSEQLTNVSHDIHQGHLVLGLTPPSNGTVQEKNLHRKGVAGWTLAAAAQAGTLCRRVRRLFALVNVVLKICLGTIFRYEPVVAYGTQLDDIWACPFGVLTWTDWRSIDIFHCLYEWLLGLLQDMLSQFQRHESTSVITALLQMICVGIVGFMLCLATAARLAWLALVYCCNIGNSLPVGLPQPKGMTPAHAVDLGVKPYEPGLKPAEPGVTPPEPVPDPPRDGTPMLTSLQPNRSAAGDDVHPPEQPTQPALDPPHPEVGPPARPGYEPLPQPAVHPTLTSGPGWVVLAAAHISALCRVVSRMFSLLTVLLSICASVILLHEPAIIYWRRLDEIWACPFWVTTWADWRNIPIFYFIYGILLGLLEDALLPFEKPQPPTIVTACGQMMSAGALCPVLLVVSGARLVCLLLAACCMTGSEASTSDPTLESLGSSPPPSSHMLDASDTLDSSDASESSGDISHKAELAEKICPAREEQEPKQATLLLMPAPCLQAENQFLKRKNNTLQLVLGSVSGQLAAAQAGCAFFMGKLLSESRERLAAVRLAKSAHRQAATDRQAKQAVTATLKQLESDRRALETAKSEAEQITTEALQHALTQDRLKLSAEARVEELSGKNGSLQAQLQTAHSELELAVVVKDRQHASFVQANKMRRTMEEHLVSTVSQRNSLLQANRQLRASGSFTRNAASVDEEALSLAQSTIIVDTASAGGSTDVAKSTDVVDPSAAKSTDTGDHSASGQPPAVVDTNIPKKSTHAVDFDSDDTATTHRADLLVVAGTSTTEESPDWLDSEIAANTDAAETIDKTRQTSKSTHHVDYSTADNNDIAVRDKTHTDTQPQHHHKLHSPAAHAKTEQIRRTLPDTDESGLQIPALHAQPYKLQQLQQDLDDKEQLILQQARQITDSTLKTSRQKSVMQQIQNALQAQELATLLFDVRLVPTRGFRNEEFDLPHSARLVGEGGSALIFKETLFGEERATKYPKKGAKASSDLAHELCMHLRCAGPHTVEILSVGMDKVPKGPMLSADVICFSMELAHHSLKDYIRQATGGFKGANRDSLVFSLQETKVILAQIVRALQGVHCKQTLHGDVKTDNFLVFTETGTERLECVKITDFGLSQNLIHGCHEIVPTPDGTRGTPGWTAPEIYSQNLPADHHSKSLVSAKADVYAAGWVFFEVLCGLSVLLFREADTDDGFAANAKHFPALDFKMKRQEVSIDSHDSSDDELQASDINEDSSEDAHDADMAVGVHSMDAVDALHVHQISNPDGHEVVDTAQLTEVVEMVNIYPDYLLHGAGLQLLKLCMAMWSAEPEARPSLENVLEELAAM